MNVFWTYYIHHVVIILCPTVPVSVPFRNPLPWPYGIVKYPSYAHFRLSAEVVGHPGIFLFILLWVLWIWTYLFFGHILFSAY